MLFTSEGTINIKNKKWEKDYSLLDPNGTSYVDQSYSKAYVRHLFKSDEILGKQIGFLTQYPFLFMVNGTNKNQIKRRNIF